MPRRTDSPDTGLPAAGLPAASGVRVGPVTLWQQQADGTLQAQDVVGPLVLRSCGEPLDAPASGCHANGLVVQPIAPVDATLAVLLVAPEWHQAASQNGVPVPAGIHPLRHGDHLEFGDRQFWVAQQTAVQPVPYDPAVHGEDMYCFLSKARLVPGQLCVVCPGQPGVVCQSIYKLSAWEALTAGDSPLRCANCGYRPDNAAWEPQPRPHRSTSHEYESLLRR